MNHSDKNEYSNVEKQSENQIETFALPNLTKEKRPISKNKTLIKSIENKDLSFLQELLISETRSDEIENLSKFHKCRLLPLLLEFLDQPLRIEALQCVYEIMNDVGNVDVFSKVLIDRTADFKKLVYLKGKIDYLKYLQKPKIEEGAENEYVETV